MEGAVGANVPDHELIVAAVRYVVDVRRGEQVVRDVGVDVGVVVAPRHGGGDGGDVADELLGEADLRVGVALDLVVRAGPLPRRVPLDARARDAVDGGALGARAGVLAPEVVIHRVGRRRGGAVLVAELLGECRGGKGEESGGLHDGLVRSDCCFLRWRASPEMFEAGRWRRCVIMVDVWLVYILQRRRGML